MMKSQTSRFLFTYHVYVLEFKYSFYNIYLKIKKNMIIDFFHPSVYIRTFYVNFIIFTKTYTKISLCKLIVMPGHKPISNGYALT